VLKLSQADAMIDERTSTLASRYVLGNVSAKERRDFEAALRADPQLQLLVKELRGTQGSGPATSDETDTRALVEVVQRRGGHDIADSASPPTAKSPEWLSWTPWLLSTCFAVICVLLISSVRIQQEKAVDLGRKWEQQNRELARLRRQNLMLQSVAAEQATNYQRRVREFESNLMKGVEQLAVRTAVVTNQLEQQLAATTRDLAAARKEVAELSNAKIALEQAVATLGVRERDRLKTARLLTLRPTPNPDGAVGALGAVWWSPADQHGMFFAANLPRLPAIQAYQFWLSDTQTKRAVSAGLLPSSTNTVQVPFTTQARVDSVERVFLTIESAIGAKVPSERRVLSSE